MQPSTGQVNSSQRPAATDATDAVFADPEFDETFADTKQREQLEAREAALRKRLDSPKSARGAWLDIAHRRLSHTQFFVVYHLASLGQPDLTNVFPHRKTAAAALRMKLKTYEWHLGNLTRGGWLRTHEFHNDDGRQSSSGIQFCVPGEAFMSGEAWVGPTQWDNRVTGRPKQRRRRAGQRSDRSASSAKRTPRKRRRQQVHHVANESEAPVIHGAPKKDGWKTLGTDARGRTYFQSPTGDVYRLAEGDETADLIVDLDGYGVGLGRARLRLADREPSLVEEPPVTETVPS